MAVTITDLRTTRNEADTTTGWAGSASPSVFTVDPNPVEATGHLGQVVNNTRAYLVNTATAINLSNTLVYVWFLPGPSMGDTATDGFGITLGDGTNRVQFKIGGSDKSVFRHNIGIPAYNCMVIDTANLPDSPYVWNGVASNLNLNAITEIGSGCRTTLKAIGGVANVFTDVVRFGNLGLRIAGGTSGSPGKFKEISDLDGSTADGRAYGIFRELGAGVFGMQGPLVFGNTTGSDSSWFEESNTTVVLEDRGLGKDKYKFTINDNGVGTTTLKFGIKLGSGVDALGSDGVNILSTFTVGGEWDSATDTNVTDVFVYGSTFNSLTEGISFRDPQEFINNSFIGCGQINPNNAVMVNSDIINSIADSALLWNFNGNTSGKLDGCSFLSSGIGHAIELGSNTPTNINFNSIIFTNYGANNTTNAAVYNNSGKEINITIAGGTIPTVRNGAGSTTNIIAGLVTITLSNLQPNTEIRVYEDDFGQNGDEIDGIENSSTSFSFSVEEGKTINIIINNLFFLPADIWGFIVPSSNTTIPISQFPDRQYFNPS
jgi:hypothetical protein